MNSDFRPKLTRPSVAVLGTSLLAALFLPACYWHPNRNQDLGVAVTPNTQPDKMLLQKAQAEIDHGRFDVGRLTLQVLINTYPDSEYLARAKLMTAESYYKQGGMSGLTQAEAEYKDFITFFPTASEAPMAEYRAGMCHFRLMGKADRDLTEARDAEAEFKTFLEKYPDNSMVPAVKGRLREVQEVLAQGDYETALLYFHKGVQRAAASRLQEIADSYPNFSQADQALWYLGQAQEKLHKQDLAVSAYDRLLTDYPLSTSAQPAKTRLVAMHKPVPKASKATLARARADRAITNQTKVSMMARVEDLFTSSPSLAATRHGPVHLGANPPPVEQTAQAQPAPNGTIAVQPLSDPGSTGPTKTPPPADKTGSGQSSPSSAADPGSPTGSAGTNAAGSAQSPAAPPATASPAKATTAQPAAKGASPVGATPPSATPATKADPAKSAKASDSSKASKSDQTASTNSTSDPHKKGKFHFLKKLVPF